MRGSDSFAQAVSRFGASLKPKLSGVAVSGAPEDQLRAPLEVLLRDLVDELGFSTSKVVMGCESSLADIKTRPDYAVTRRNALVGFIEVKAPGKGADPRRFQGKHDREQWDKLNLDDGKDSGEILTQRPPHG